MEQNVNANIVQARQFQLVDEENELRAQLATGPDGAASLEFMPNGETPRVSVGVNRSGTAVIALRDETGQIRARVAVEASGTPTTFNIRDANDQIRAQILLQNEDAVGVTLQNAAGRPLAFMQVLPGDYAEMGVSNRSETKIDSLTNK